jgi:nitrogen fixation protein NifU and related proteins
MSYTPQVIDHFQHPRNFGGMEDADGVGMVGNPVCGDVMKLYLKVGKNKKGEEIVEDIKFETFGCAAAIATSSMITELAIGKTLDQALKIENEDVATELGELPVEKIHCSVLAADALREAIEDYFKNSKVKSQKCAPGGKNY